MGVRLRSRLQLARRLRRLSAAQARDGRRGPCDPNGSRRRLRDEGTVSFRLRVTLFTAAAVAVAAIGASVAMYLVVQGQLMHQVENNLQLAAQNAARGGPGPGDGRRGFGPQSQFMTGRPDMYAQIITAGGAIFRTDFDTPNTGLVVQEVKDVASGKRAAFFATADAQDTRLAMYVVPIQGGGAIEVVQDLALTGIDAALAQTRLLLIAFAAGAILLAAGLGALIGRAALAPVKRLTATVEEVTKTRDLSRRVAAQGRDELSRLGTSFDAMLGQLETSLRSQRQLVADASHELRTPLTSLRTTLELLERGQPTDPAERQQVLGELVGQMERLSTLVSDLLDLARDEQTQLLVEDVHLDAIAADAIAEMRMRYPGVHFELDQSS